MKIIDYLKENKSAMRSGLPIELRDLIDERTVYAGNYEKLVEFLEEPGLEHVRNATFVLDDIYNGLDRIVLYYVKEINKYDDFDLRQFANRVIELQKQAATIDARIANAVDRSEKTDTVVVGKDDIIKE